jgi:hypothetical protein
LPEPRLRTAERVPAPYPLGRFPVGLAASVGRDIIYILATSPSPRVEGETWERIFANAVAGDWRPSNIGLDDVVLGNCAWGAKTVYAPNPWTQRRVRLISGRNSPLFSFESSIDPQGSPQEIGGQVLEIWNARVEAVRKRHRHVRTAVLVKSKDLLRLTVFELETVRYNPGVFAWSRNSRGNLEGYSRDRHVFTWQPHGSQFTIIEDVPANKTCIEVRKPPRPEPSALLRALGVTDSWIRVVTPED